MASKICIADGNFKTAGTWGVVDATSMLDSEAGNTELTTSYVSSSAFTPGAIVVSGVAVKIANVAASGAYTMSVRLYNSTDSVAVAGTEVTVNLTDLPVGQTTTTNAGGWVLFKFSSPVTLEADHNYTVQGKESNAAANINLYRDATANNWSRMLLTTTTGAPANTDILHIMEEKTGVGAATARVVTIDQSATSYVDLGSGTDGTVAITISDGGTLQYGYTAATSYYLKCSGNLIVYSGGTFTIGTVANPIPRNSTAVLEFDPVADGGMGLIVRNGATFTAQGLSRTSGKNIVSCLLNTDEAVNSTSLGVDTDTGWLDNDKIAVASTTQTYSQCETGLLNGNAGASSLTVDGFGGAGGGLAYAHSGTIPTQAEVILLTRNVKIRAVSSTIVSFTYFGNTATVDMDWVELYWLGQNTTNKYAMSIVTTTGSFNCAYCSLHDVEDDGFYANNSALNNVTLSYFVMYNLSSANSGYAFFVGNTSQTSNSFSNIIGILSGTNNGFMYLQDAGASYQNITIAGAGSSTVGGINITSDSGQSTFGTFSNLTAHSCASYGFQLNYQNSEYLTINTMNCWRNNSSSGAINCTGNGFIINTLNAFGNNSSNLFLNNARNFYFYDSNFNGDSSFSTSYGVNGNNVYDGININFINCNFGTASGIKTAHSSYDFYPPSICVWDIKLNNTILASTNEVYVSFSSNFVSIKSTKHDQTVGNHKTWFRRGIITTDSVANMYRTATPSMRLTPNSASYKLVSGSFKVNINSGQTCTPIVYVRESVAGDGTDYNGNRPRLILKRNDAIGVTADAVIDTATASAEGAFEQLTGTTAAATDDGVMEFVIDCDGTTGWVNVDDFSATVA